MIGESEGEDRFHIVQFGRKANFIFDLKQRSRSALSALIQGIGNPHSGVTYLPFAERRTAKKRRVAPGRRNGIGCRRVLGWTMWKGRGSRSVEKGKARRIRKRKKKNRKRNDPGKAQCLNGRGAEVSNSEILVGRGPDQARSTVQARAWEVRKSGVLKKIDERHCHEGKNVIQSAGVLRVRRRGGGGGVRECGPG